MTIYHNHHIIPRHMGGSDDPSNLVKLTVEEHAYAHLQLYEKHGLIQDLIAYRMLKGLISVEEARRLASKNRDTSYMQTPEYKEKISKANKGREPWNKGKKGVQKHSKESRHKMSISRSRGNGNKAKPCEYNGKRYSCIKDAIDDTGLTGYMLSRDPNFKII